MKKDSVLMVFDEGLPKMNLGRYDKVIFGKEIESLTEPGDIYEASVLAEEMSRLTLPSGVRITKSFVYKGYEIWWMRYDSIFRYYCLPYTQYKKLLNYLKEFQVVEIINPPYKSLFAYFLEAHGCKVEFINKSGYKLLPRPPFGILFQIILTIISLPILMITRPGLMVFIGDKFEKDRDYDFRMKFIYNELRGRGLSFVEFIRSLESWKTVLAHALTRKRAVIYSEAVTYVGGLLALISGGRSWAEKQFGAHILPPETDPERRFKLLVAMQPLLHIYDDIWAIRIMKVILQLVGIKTAFITAVVERNFHAFVASKLNSIPTVGILHGAAPYSYIVYDFLPGFDGEKMLSVDKYGLWSEWWKEYYTRHSRAYRPEQLYVSGPMRPLEGNPKSEIPNLKSTDKIKVLFISEQLAAPQEVMPYLEALINYRDVELAIKLRPYRDGFEEWLIENRPDLLKAERVKIVRGAIQDAINDCDIAVGSNSTAVLEALLQLKVPLLFNTRKWGDCFELKEYGVNHPFFADNPTGLLEKIKEANLVSSETLKDLQRRYFGDPYKNGGAWVVDQLEEALNGCLTRK